MLGKISEIWDRWSTVGMKFPYAYDQESKGPSETLLFFKATTTITIASLIALQFKAVTPGTVFTTAGVTLLAFVMYRLRKLDKVKIDVDDQSIELDGQDETKQ